VESIENHHEGKHSGVVSGREKSFENGKARGGGGTQIFARRETVGKRTPDFEE